MASVNAPTRRAPVYTHEGGKAVHISPMDELRRSVLSSLLWEDAFYESGKDHAARIAALVAQVKPADVAALAIEAREQMHLRHTPLALVRELARVNGNGPLVADTLARVIQRPDELSEYVAIYFKDGRKPLSAGSKRGLRAAFGKFNRYSLAKYRSDDKAVKLADVLRMVRPKPVDAEQAALWKELRTGTLASVDTWESELSAGKDKKDTFERLLREQKLGGLAFLRNLRNMQQAGVDLSLMRERFAGKFDRVLPFRFLAAARHAPMLVSEIGDAMLRAVDQAAPKLRGTTIVLVDVSGSMDDSLSSKSEMKRVDAAGGLAVLARERGDSVRVITFSGGVVEVPSYRGIALADAISRSQPHGSTYLGQAMQTINPLPHDRLIVITDEQSADAVPAPTAARAYMVNVASNKRGVGYGPWTHIDGWSERVVDFILALESNEYR
jgi:60 kDa SS-A/Ro ribonucleoprotein